MHYGAHSSAVHLIAFREWCWRRQRHPTPVVLPGKSHRRRSLKGCSPWGYEESDTTERLHFPFSLSCIGEGNGNPLQCSWLENPRDGEPGGLPSMGSHRVGHDWSDLAAAAAAAAAGAAELLAGRPQSSASWACIIQQARWADSQDDSAGS